MIGAFYIAEQYLQRVAGFSALGASGALVLVALLVGVGRAAGRQAGRPLRRAAARAPRVRRRRRSAWPCWGSPASRWTASSPMLPLIPVGPGAGDAVRPDQPGRAQRQPAGLARPHLGAAVGRPAGRRGGWRRAGRDRAAGDAHRRRPCTTRCCWGRSLPRRGDPAATRLTARAAPPAGAGHQRLTDGARGGARCATPSPPARRSRSRRGGGAKAPVSLSGRGVAEPVGALGRVQPSAVRSG